MLLSYISLSYLCLYTMGKYFQCSMISKSKITKQSSLCHKRCPFNGTNNSTLLMPKPFDFLTLLNWRHVCSFMIIFTMKSNIPFSLVSELHNYNIRSATSNQIFKSSFATTVRRFRPSIFGCFFSNNIGQFIRDKLSKKIFRKALKCFCLAQY